jgi:enoyl-CoA hydratase/carnithine racemase
MTTATDPRVTVETKDRVATVTINRPEARNALTKAMYAAIRDACAAAEADPQVDVVVLRGVGGAFAVGGDLKEMLTSLESGDTAKVLDYEDYLPFETIRALKKPTVAVIDGLCMGGGLTLALMCDILLATDRSKFAIPEAKVGIVDGHLPRLLREAVPPARLRYWMFTGAAFPAHEAADAGLITKVVAPEALEGAVAQVVAELKASSPEAISAVKRILIETRPLSPMTDAYLSMLQPHVLAKLQQFSKR